MRASTPRSAMESVLRTPELLEAILLQVDMTTLLTSALRVDRNWHDLMTTSPAIQQNLFFKSGPLPPSRTTLPSPGIVQDHRHRDDFYDKDCPNRNNWPVINPLLEKKFGRLFFDTGSARWLFSAASIFNRMPWSRRAIALALAESRTEEVDWSDEGLGPQALLEEKEARRRFTRSGASWRRMLVSQPPPLSLGYWRKDMDPEPGNRYLNLPRSDFLFTAFVKPRTLTSAPQLGEGLRMGELYDIVQYRAGHHERNTVYFSVVWCHTRGSSMKQVLGRITEKMLEQTILVVEFYHANERIDHEPRNVEAFDAAFRCDDFQHVKVETEKVREDSFAT